MPLIVLTNRIPASPARCFEMSLSVEAHTASMRHSGERVVDGVTSGVLGLGETVTWHARHCGIPFAMTSRIVDRVVLTRYLTMLLRQRNDWLVEALSSPSSPGS